MNLWNSRATVVATADRHRERRRLLRESAAPQRHREGGENMTNFIETPRPVEDRQSCLSRREAAPSERAGDQRGQAGLPVLHTNCARWRLFVARPEW